MPELRYSSSESNSYKNSQLPNKQKKKRAAEKAAETIKARQGQRRGVEVHTFATKNTCESRIYKAIREKEKGNRDFINLTK